MKVDLHDDAPILEHRTFCRLCPALCGVIVRTRGPQVVSVVGDREHPVSGGYTCPKGRSLGRFHHAPDRLDTPAMGPIESRRGASWDGVMDDLATRIRGMRAEHGAGSFGAYFGAAGSDAAGLRMARKLFHALGTPSVYSCATVDAPCRPYVAELVTGNAQLYTRGADLERATLTVLVGLNPLVSHGHNASFPNPRARLDALRERGPLWVVDPRRTETAAIATHHLAPLPGTDHIWLAAVVRELLGDGVDEADLRRRADGVDELRATVAEFTLERAAARCDVELGLLRRLVADIREHRRVAVVAGTGVTMTPRANLTEWLTWVLAIVTDSFDQAGGTVVNPGFLRTLDRREWTPTDGAAGPGPTSRPELPRRLNELPAAAIAGEIEAGHLRGLFVVGGNPITALPDTDRIRSALRRLELLVVVDVVENDVVALATHVLPAAGMLERADLPAGALDSFYPVVATQYTPAVFAPEHERRPLWWIAATLGRRLDLDLLPPGADPEAWTDDDALAPLAARAHLPFEELKAAGRCLVADRIPTGWVQRQNAGRPLYRLAPPPLTEQLAAPADALPGQLLLIPRRQRRHVNSAFPPPARPTDVDAAELLVSTVDAARLGIADGQAIEVVSSTGTARVVARSDPAMRSGTCSLPHGYAAVNVNRLTSDVELDELTGMPVYAALPVTLRPIPDRLPGRAEGTGDR